MGGRKTSSKKAVKISQSPEKMSNAPIFDFCKDRQKISPVTEKRYDQNSK